MQNDVFISYSRYDTEIVDSIVSKLEHAGLMVWIDREGIESGDEFKKVILQAIKDSSIVLYFSSRNSNRSEWTAKEIGVAVKYKKHIIPILLDDSNFNEVIEFDLINRDYVDIREESHKEEKLERLVKSIKNKLFDLDRSLLLNDKEEGEGHDCNTRQDIVIAPKKKKTKMQWGLALGVFVVAVALTLFLLLRFGSNKGSSLNPETSLSVSESAQLLSEQLEKDGWLIDSQTKTMAEAITDHKMALKNGQCQEIIGRCSGASSRNTAHVMANHNAVVTYTQLAKQSLVTGIEESGLDGNNPEDIDRFVFSFERLISGAIEGELKESFAIYKETGTDNKTMEYNVYYIVDEEKAAQQRQTALKRAAEEANIPSEFAEQFFN